MGNTVYTYGGGEALFKTLNGVQMIFNSGITADLIYLMTFVGLVWAAFQGIQQNSFMPKLSWFTKYVLITSMFITPKSSLWVSDSVTGFKDKVDNLPIGLVLPASVFSSIGHSITVAFDQAFSTVDNIPYTKYGQSFGAALISQARNFKIQDSSFRENIESFIDNCVIYDVMVGTKYSLSELRDSDNIWELASKNASNIRMMTYRDGKNGKNLISCKEGITNLNSYWLTDIEKLGIRFGNSIFGKYGQSLARGIENSHNSDLGKAFSKNIQVVLDLYSNHSSAIKNLKQVMLINAFADIPMSYGVVRAKQQQQESWLISGQLAREILPTLHAVFAALMYASFTLIVGMLVLPSGFRVFGNYLGLLIWIETWPPLFAVLNLLTNISSKAYGGDFASITMNNASQIISHNNNISVIASGMMMVLPYLSYNILKGGAGQFVHLAGQIMGASQGAVASAATEVTSGNRSLDNVSLSNGQWFNNSGFKTDMNAMFRSGHQEYQLSSGMIVRETSGGKTIMQAGPGITESTGSKSMYMSENYSTQTHQSISKEKANIASWTQEYEKAEQFMQQKGIELIDRMAAGIASGESYNFNHSTADGKILNEGMAKSKNLHDNFAYNSNQVVSASVSGGVNANIGVNGRFRPGGSSILPVSGGVDASVSLGLGGQVTGTVDNIDTQGLSEDKSVSTSKDIINQSEAVARAVKDIQFTENQSEEKALAQSLVGTYEKMQSLKKNIRESQEEIARYQSTEDSSKSSSYMIGQESYGAMVEFITSHRDKDGFRISPIRAAQIIEDGGEEFMQHQRAYSSKLKSHKVVQEPVSDRKHLIEENIPKDINLEDKFAEMEKSTGSLMKDQKTVNSAAKEKVEQQEKTVSAKIQKNEQEILDNGERMQKEIDKSDNNRIGKGRAFGRQKEKTGKFVE